MKMKYRILFLFFIGFGSAQNPVLAQMNRSFKVNPGEKVAQAIPADVIYEYPEFQPGTVQFKNGKAGMARMNYSSLLKEIEFINDKLDTTALDDANAMHYISIAMDTFYFDKVYLKQISNKHGVKLAENRILMLSNRQKIGGFGEINGGSVETKEQVSSNANAVKTLVAKEILTFTENRVWYFGDKFNRFKQASRKNVMDMFGKMKPGLDKFLDDNNINYFNESDIKKLAAFLQE
jgi:hypothetical protein